MDEIQRETQKCWKIAYDAEGTPRAEAHANLISATVTAKERAAEFSCRVEVWHYDELYTMIYPPDLSTLVDQDPDAVYRVFRLDWADGWLPSMILGSPEELARAIQDGDLRQDLITMLQEGKLDTPLYHISVIEMTASELSELQPWEP